MSGDTAPLLQQAKRDVIAGIDAAITTLKGSVEFRDAVEELLKGTPHEKPASHDADFEGLYGRLRNALRAQGEAARDPGPRPPTSGVVVTDNRGTTFTEVRPGCFETPNGWCVNVTTSAGDPGLRVSVQQLIAKWRLAAKQDAVYGSAQALKSSREYFGTVNAAFALADCADELEALLARVPSPQAIERDLISDLVDVCYTDGTSPQWRLCLGCEMEHHREAHAYDVCHARPDCVVAVAEKWLREQLAKARVPSRPASQEE